MAFRKEQKTQSNFDSIRISLASPEEILENSHGEVTKHETVSYRTYKPERDGLYCERIFGPVKDYECHCGKYKGSKFKGITCDRCGVEVTQKIVRRERMGHISLNVPVVHVWYFRSVPNKSATFSDSPQRHWRRSFTISLTLCSIQVYLHAPKALIPIVTRHKRLDT